MVQKITKLKKYRIDSKEKLKIKVLFNTLAYQTDNDVIY